MAGLAFYEEFTKPQGVYVPRGKQSLQYMARNRDRMRRMGLIGPEPPTPLEQAAAAQQGRAQEEEYAIAAEERQAGAQQAAVQQGQEFEAEQKRLDRESKERMSAAKAGPKVPALPGRRRAPRGVAEWQERGEKRWGEMGAAVAPTPQVGPPVPALPQSVQKIAQELNVPPEVVLDMTGAQQQAALGKIRTGRAEQEAEAKKTEEAEMAEDALIGETAQHLLKMGKIPTDQWEDARMEAADLVEAGFDLDDLQKAQRASKADAARIEAEWKRSAAGQQAIRARGKETRKTAAERERLRAGRPPKKGAPISVTARRALETFDTVTDPKEQDVKLRESKEFAKAGDKDAQDFLRKLGIKW